MQRPDYPQHKLLLEWLIGMSVLIFAIFIAWQEQLISILLEGDRSFISMIILFAFLLVNLHVLSRVIALSRERNITTMVQSLITHSDKVSFSVNKEEVRLCEKSLPESYVARHFRNLAGRLSNHQAVQDPGSIQSNLLSALDKRIRNGLKYGWMFADLMIKLGLVGTVVGFVLMLGSVASLEQYDVATMQDLLRNMSGGMRVALFTTLSGLIAGLMLGMQYQFLDHHSDTLLAEIEELSEVYILPALLNGEQKIQSGS